MSPLLYLALLSIQDMALPILIGTLVLIVGGGFLVYRSRAQRERAAFLGQAVERLNQSSTLLIYLDVTHNLRIEASRKGLSGIVEEALEATRGRYQKLCEQAASEATIESNSFSNLLAADNEINRNGNPPTDLGKTIRRKLGELAPQYLETITSTEGIAKLMRDLPEAVAGQIRDRATTLRAELRSGATRQA